jgi:signal transduction histidine kinase
MRACYVKSKDYLPFRRCLIVVRHLRFGRVGIGRLAVLGAAFCVTIVVVALVPHAGLIYELPAQRVALETTASLITLLAGFLILGRLRRNARINELALVAALAVIALSNILFGMLPMLTGSAIANPGVWAAIIGGSAGSLLFAVAAFVPRAGLRRPRQAQGLAAMGVLGILVLAVILSRVFGSGLPSAITPSAGPHADYDPVANPALAVVQITAAVLTVMAAAGYLRRSEGRGEEFSGWLAVAAVFAAASHVSDALYPAIYLPRVSLGDIFRFCFYVVLLAGLVREIWSYWQTLVSATLAEERRRIACDLHDGLSQELAFLTRNLSGLQGTADEETLRQLRVSVDRARLASRQAIDRVAAPARPAIADALTDAVGEVAERFGLNLELDLASGIGMAPARADALVRIACEALTNVARHSGSRQVSLVLRRDGGRVRLRVRDSGRGFDPAACRGGFGLRSMRDRARSVGGDLRINSQPGSGSQVEATL